MSTVRYGLAVDIGNTRTSYGLFRLTSGKVSTLGQVAAGAVQPMELVRKIKTELGQRKILCAVIGSVVPSAVPIWTNALSCFTNDILVTHHKLNHGIPISYPKPETLGADRLANAAGAFHKYGTPVIAADFGTAVTFDVISGDLGYVGGVIQPGLKLMFEYLADRTALLPEITRTAAVPDVGTSTETAMQLGAYLGYRGMVGETFRYLVDKYKDKNLTLVATGGDHEWVVKGFDPPVISDHTLTLFGLGIIYRLNRMDV